MKKILYIYKITNILNTKMYIGKHSSLRLQNNYYGSGVAINKAIKKYGKHNFSKEIICVCESEEELNEKEIYYIKTLNTFKDGYNMTLGGEGMLGHHPSIASRKKMSDSQKAKYENNPALRQIMSERAKARTGELNSFYGKKLSPEHIEKMRQNRVKVITGGNNPSAVKVRCIETGEEFDTAKEASKKVGLKYSTTILKCAKGHSKSAGGYRWELI